MIRAYFFSQLLPEWVELLVNIMAKVGNIPSSKNVRENVSSFYKHAVNIFDLKLLANMVAKLGNIVGEHVNFD